MTARKDTITTPNGVKLIFEEPTAIVGRGQTSKYIPWLQELRKHPGRWVKFPERVKGASATARAIKTGELKGVNAGEFETTTRGGTTTDRTALLYVKYIGKN
jgi:hypothetical protein